MAAGLCRAAIDSLPLLGSNQDSPDPLPLRLSPPLNVSSVRGLDCAFTFAVTRSGGSHPVSTPSPLGAWLGVASQGSADFESIHARRFRRGVQRAHREVAPESGVLPVTPRGSITPELSLLKSRARDDFTLKLAVGQLRIASRE